MRMKDQIEMLKKEKALLEKEVNKLEKKLNTCESKCDKEVKENLTTKKQKSGLVRELYELKHRTFLEKLKDLI